MKVLHTCQPDWADSSRANVWDLLAEHNPAHAEGRQTSLESTPNYRSTIQQQDLRVNKGMHRVVWRIEAARFNQHEKIARRSLTCVWSMTASWSLIDPLRLWKSHWGTLEMRPKPLGGFCDTNLKKERVTPGEMGVK